jgi:CheY-like chemotaxis protein
MDSSSPFFAAGAEPLPKSRNGVFVVHSDGAVVDEVREFLRPRGLEVRAFKTANECLVAIRERRPDLVICELEYSQGATVAGRLLLAGFAVPCLVLTAGYVGKFADLAKAGGQASGLWTVAPEARGPALQRAIVDVLLAGRSVTPCELPRLMASSG